MNKKVAAILSLVIALVLFTGCGAKAEKEDIKVYSFKGNDGAISMTNGVIVVGEDEDICYGGDLKVKPEAFADIASYTVTIYIDNGDSKEKLLVEGVKDESGKSIEVSRHLGKISGEFSKDDLVKKIEDNLWVEIETKKLDGKEKLHKMQLKVEDVTNKTVK